MELRDVLIIGGLGFAGWYFFVRKDAGSAAAVTQPGAAPNFSAAYPGAAPVPMIPSAVFSAQLGSPVYIPAKANDQPVSQLPPPPRFSRSVGSATAAVGNLGSRLVPGVSAGTGTSIALTPRLRVDSLH